jgi:predicted RNA polymerase sigma factor
MEKFILTIREDLARMRELTESEDSIFSPYHLEAAVACLHCAARKFEYTNWGAKTKRPFAF